jgi:type IV pilus assembly protein PilF
LAEIDYRRKRFDDARDWLKKLHAKIEPTAETVWLSLRIDRKQGDRRSEAANTGVMRGKFRDSPEYILMMRGEFD